MYVCIDMSIPLTITTTMIYDTNALSITTMRGIKIYNPNHILYYHCIYIHNYTCKLS